MLTKSVPLAQPSTSATQAWAFANSPMNCERSSMGLRSRCQQLCPKLAERQHEKSREYLQQFDDE